MLEKLNKDVNLSSSDTDREAITKVNNLTANLFHGVINLLTHQKISLIWHR